MWATRLTRLRRTFYLFVEYANLRIQPCQQLQQVLPPPCRPAFQRQLTQRLLARFAPQLPLLLHAPVQHQVLQTVLYPRTDRDQPVAMHEQLS
ncbi:MAG TPA: hypothetical protein VGF08_13575, partial [Terriglobales bacterium]